MVYIFGIGGSCWLLLLVISDSLRAMMPLTLRYTADKSDPAEHLHTAKKAGHFTQPRRLDTSHS